MEKKAETWQVTLTGRRTRKVEDQELVQKLVERFRLGEPQARGLLTGRRTVKRQLERKLADKLVALLQDMGLEAVVEAAAAAPVTAAAAAQPLPSAKAGPTAASPAPQGRTAAPPQKMETAAPLQKAATASPLQQLAALSKQRLPTPRTTSLYLASLLLVTALCIVMPVIYFGLVALTAWSWFWYLTHIHQYLHVHNFHIILLAYAAPGVAGFVLVMFMLKPFFSRTPAAPRPVALDASREPELVAGIQALCRAIGISPPREIHLTWDVNAWVHFRSGWFSLLTGHKVLTIGMPLVAGMTARQLVGVLAHEFGHFAQRAGMRCYFVINSVNRWLEYRAYGVDSWDVRLRKWAESDDTMISLVVMTAQGGIALTRLLMRGLFQASFRLSQHFSRQMEFDADRYEALLAGSSAFRGSAVRLRVLAQAFHEANEANIHAWREGKLLRNLPVAVAMRSGDFDAGRIGAIEREMTEGETRYWDSHPADMQRIENAEQRQLPGVFCDESPASSLMRGFESACEQVTAAFYRQHGLKYNQGNLRDVEEIISVRREKDAGNENIDIFFNGQFQPLPMLDLRQAETEAAAPLSWQAAIDRLRALSPDIMRDWRAAWEAELARPRYILAMNLGLRPSQLALAGGDDRPPHMLREDYDRICARGTEEQRRLNPALAFYARRFQAAGQAMAGEKRARYDSLLDLLQLLQAEEKCIRRLLESHELADIMERWVLNGAGQEVQRELADARAEFHAQGLALLASMEKVPQTLKEGATVAGYLRLRNPLIERGRSDVAVFQKVASELPATIMGFYELLVGELAGMAAAEEKLQGIRPIKIVLVKKAVA